MNGAMNTARMGLVLGALMLVLDLQAASAQSPSITVSNQQSKGTRRVEIVILDPVNAVETAPEAGTLSAAPDDGQILGTLIARGKRYVVTETRMLAVGDTVAGHTVAQVSLGHVVISRGARTYELDLTTGTWSAVAVSTAE